MAESQAKIAQKTWELTNNIMEVCAGDEIYKYDRQQQQSLLAAKPWDKDPHFFKAWVNILPNEPRGVGSHFKIIFG